MISNDGISKEDLLGRNRFAKQIVNSLTNAFTNIEESFVIGVTGRWGSGKSTLLSYIESNLISSYKNDSEGFRTIHFNPWQNTTADIEELQRNLLEVIIKELESIKWKNKIEEGNNKFKSYLKYLNYLKFVKHIHPIAKNVIEAVDEYSNQSSVHSIQEIKDQADKLIKEKGIKIYVFIDDIDRLTHEEIAIVFKVIKLNVNFVNTCFIIAYDKQVVAEALGKQYNLKGEEYLEKIIQVDFAVPEILEEQMEEIFFEKTTAIFDSLKQSFNKDLLLKVWSYYGFKEYFRTLRDIKRYCNSLLFSLPNISEEVNITDFLVLEAIKVFDYKSYQMLYDDFLIIQRKAIWSSSSFDQSTINNYKHPTTKALLEYLFIQNHSLSELLNGSRNAKRLNDSEFFRRYYTLYLPSKDITEEALEQFLTIGNNREQILSDAIKHNRIQNLLRRLGDKNLKAYYKVSDLYIFDAFLKFWDGNEKKITPELDEDIWHSYFNLAHSFLNKFEAARQAITALMVKENDYQPMRFVFNHFIFLIKEEKRGNRQLYGDIDQQLELLLPELRKAFENHLKKLGSGYFWKATRNDNPFTSRLHIHSYAKFCPGEYQKSLEEYISNSAFQIFLLKQSFLCIDDNTNEPFRVDFKNKDLLLPGNSWNIFIDSLKNSKSGSWSESDQAYVDYFLSTLKDFPELVAPQ